MQQEFLDLYERELNALYDRAADFAAEFPGLADRLGGLTRDRLDPGARRAAGGGGVSRRARAHEARGGVPGLHHDPSGTAPAGIPGAGALGRAVAGAARFHRAGSRRGRRFAAGSYLDATYREREQRVSCRFRLAAPLEIWPLEIDTARYFATPAPLQALGLEVAPGHRRGAADAGGAPHRPRHARRGWRSAGRQGRAAAGGGAGAGRARPAAGASARPRGGDERSLRADLQPLHPDHAALARRAGRSALRADAARPAGTGRLRRRGAAVSRGGPALCRLRAVARPFHPAAEIPRLPAAGLAGRSRGSTRRPSICCSSSTRRARRSSRWSPPRPCGCTRRRRSTSFPSARPGSA